MGGPTFALIGCGYVGPKHGEAIKRIGGTLVAANDWHDNAGWLDKDWKRCGFTREPLDEMWRDGGYDLPIWSAKWVTHNPVDWIVIATPNDLHDMMVNLYLPLAKVGVICEKPLGLNEDELNRMALTERYSGKRLHTILNLRHSGPALRAKAWAEANRPGIVEVRYSTPRGAWYDASWKEEPARSGGMIFNLGIHILDWLVWVFGEATDARVLGVGERSVSFETTHRDNVVCCVDLDSFVENEAERTIQFNGEHKFDLTNEFAKLHTECYREIMAGRGPGIEDARPSILLAQRLSEEIV